HVLRQVRRVGGDARHLLERQRFIGLHARQDAVGEIHVLHIDAEAMRGDAFRLGDDLARRAENRRATKRRRPRAAGAFADGDLIGIALDVADFSRIDAETVADDLLEHRLVALAVIDAAGIERHPAAAVEAYLRRLEPGLCGALDRIGHAEPAQPAAPGRLD